MCKKNVTSSWIHLADSSSWVEACCTLKNPGESLVLSCKCYRMEYCKRMTMACISAFGIGSSNCIWSLYAHISAVSSEGDFGMSWAVVSEFHLY